jgi:hypothetical protein
LTPDSAEKAAFARYQRQIAPPKQLLAAQIEPQPPKSTSRPSAQGVKIPNAIALWKEAEPKSCVKKT